jgi:hypothetical protein
MKPVFQQHPTATAEALGDCVRACVASILELPIDQVPHFGQQRSTAPGEALWSQALRQWLRPRGMAIMVAEVLAPDGHFAAEGMQFHHIRIGEHRSGSQHAAVFYGDQLAHDPLPVNPEPFQPDVYPQHYVILVMG